MVLHYDDPSFEDQGGRFQAHFVLEIRSLFRLILYWTILGIDKAEGFHYNYHTSVESACFGVSRRPSIDGKRPMAPLGRWLFIGG